MKIVSRDQWFEVKTLSDGVRLIHEPYIRPFYRCNLWHIQGRDKDLLVDSGSGLVSLREQLPWLTERPLLADQPGAAVHQQVSVAAISTTLPAITNSPNAWSTRLKRKSSPSPMVTTPWPPPSSATTCLKPIRIARCATPNTGSGLRPPPV